MLEFQQQSKFSNSLFSTIKMSFVLLSAIFVVNNMLLVVTHSAIISTPFIFGGEKATKNQFPYLVSLRLKIGENYKHVCGASILSDCVLITAAHCIEPDLPVTDYGISVGAHMKDENGRIYLIKKCIVHPNNAFIKSNDIALIILDESIQFNEYTKPIEIDRNFIDENVKAVAAGWGANEDDYNGLKFTTVITITNDECRKRFPTAVFEDFGTLCAYSGVTGTGICSGDSGGPLISNNKLIGLTSWSSMPCANSMPDGFTRISDYTEWIAEIITQKS